MKNTFKRGIITLLPLLVLLVIWQAVVRDNARYDFIMGSPAGIWRELCALAAQQTLGRDFGVTLLETLLGFAAGSIIGTAAGLILWGSAKLFRIVRPYLVALGALPAFALAPVLIFWVGTGILSKVLLGFLSTFVVAVVQAHTGASEADTNLIKLTRAFGGTKQQVFFKIIVPSAAIWVVAGVRLNVGMALLGAFVGELISSRMGLGHLIVVAEGLYNVNQIWVGVLGFMGIATIFHWCILPVEHRVNRWKPKTE